MRKANSNSIKICEALSHAYPNIKKVEWENLTNKLFNEIICSLSEGKNVVCGSFGTFKVSVVKAHTGRNPRTGESVEIPDKKKVVFTPTKDFIDSINEPILDDVVK